MKVIYNPDEEELYFLLAGQDYRVPANSVSVLPDEVANHAVKALGMWGVVELSVEEAKWEEEKAKAEMVYKAATRAWCTKELEQYSKDSTLFSALGIEKTLTEDQAWAIAWLKKHGA